MDFFPAVNFPSRDKMSLDDNESTRKSQPLPGDGSSGQFGSDQTQRQAATTQPGFQRRKDPLVGTLFADRYKILEVLGHGGMGVVYKAHHEFMDKVVAIKMLLPQLVSDDRTVQRFQYEARAASRLSHPNIIALHDFGLTPDNGVPYLVMDYIEGKSLSEVIKTEKQVSVTRSIAIFTQVADALHHAHSLGVIHRDLKPANIMLIKGADGGELVKVVDFGVAKIVSNEGDDAQRLTATGEIFGSPVYMSPEQCLGHQLKATSDVYALGCVMYETVTGKLPIVGATPLETLSNQLQTIPDRFAEARPDLYIPEGLEAIVFTALAKNPDDRQQTMQEVKDELTSLGQGRSSSSISTRRIKAGASGDTYKKAPAGLVSMRTPAREPDPKTTAPPTSSGGKAVLVAAIAVSVLAVVGLAAGGLFMFMQSGHNNAPTTSPTGPAAHNTAGPSSTPHHTANTNFSSHSESTDLTTHSTTTGTKITTANKKPDAAPPREHQKPKKNKTPANVDTTATAARPTDTSVVQPAHHVHKDFYNYSMSHEGQYNNPVDLPMKQAGGGQ
jgi:serine/threonine protein kinase